MNNNMLKVNHKYLVLASLAIATSLLTINPQKVRSAKEVFSLPQYAKEIRPNVYSLGKANDHGRNVEGFAIVHKSSQAKPNGAGNPKVAACYGFLARNAKWKAIEPWVVNTTNASFLDENFVFNNLATNIQKWEVASGKDILGDGAVTLDTLLADTISPDNKNEVYFADINESGAIGVTIVWGIFGGPPQGRELVEWDQVYDDIDYPWSATGEAAKMDFENIATHELGHSAGLADLYETSCSEETMYGYANYGEINKRDLAPGDIRGIAELYK